MRVTQFGGYSQIYTYNAAAMPIRYWKMGTPIERTKAAPFINTTRATQATQPTALWSCRWRVLRKKRMKRILAAVWL